MQSPGINVKVNRKIDRERDAKKNNELEYFHGTSADVVNNNIENRNAIII